MKSKQNPIVLAARKANNTRTRVVQSKKVKVKGTKRQARNRAISDH